MKHLTLVVVAITIAVPASGHACSKIGFAATTRSTTTAHFIATAMADTVLAGAGTVRYIVAPGHSGFGGDRKVFGQLFSVERMGGLASRLLGQHRKQVILVPWDYAADCRPTPWYRSAVWVEPGSRGLLTAVLRDSAHWAGGIPTFDVFSPDMEPYPQRVQRHMMGRRASPDSLVPIDELFGLMELFPDRSLLPDSAVAATESLFQWARANPALTHRYPIDQALWSARVAVRTQWLRAIQSPFTGTWRFTVAMSSGPPRTFYARTRGIPSSAWDSTDVMRLPVSDPAFVRRPDGYHLLAVVYPSLDSLPTSCGRERDSDREGYMVVVEAPVDSSTAGRIWRGTLEMSLPLRAFLGDTALERFARADFDVYYRRSRMGLPVATRARFTRSPDGTVRGEQMVALEDGRSVTLKGDLISRDVVACKW